MARKRDSKRRNSQYPKSYVSTQKKHKLFKRGEEIELTQIEYSILECFFNRPEESIERGTFVEAVWGEKYYGDDKVVDVNIRRLRLKIEDDPSNPEHLITVWGQGYRWIK